MSRLTMFLSVVALMAGIAMIPFGYMIGFLWVAVGCVGALTAKITQEK